MPARPLLLASHLRPERPLPPAEAHADARPRCAAVAVVIHELASNPHVLLLRRAERVGDPWSGHVALPGGRWDPTDGDLFQTAVREAREETALELASAHYLGCGEPLHPRQAGPKGMPVTPFVFALGERPPLVLSEEATHAFWFPLQPALRGEFDDSLLYQSGPLRFPCWKFSGEVIWGLTLRILQNVVTSSE